MHRSERMPLPRYAEVVRQCRIADSPRCGGLLDGPVLERAV